MLQIRQSPATTAVTTEHPVATVGRYLVRYAVVIVIAWIDALKYTGYEAAAIHPLIAHSPIFSWLDSILSVRALHHSPSQSAVSVAHPGHACACDQAPKAPDLRLRPGLASDHVTTGALTLNSELNLARLLGSVCSPWTLRAAQRPVPARKPACVHACRAGGVAHPPAARRSRSDGRGGEGLRALPGAPERGGPVTVDDVRAAFPEWTFMLSVDGWWHARLTTSGKPQPELTARTVAGLAERINDLIAGESR
jgi:hypothetical protein